MDVLVIVKASYRQELRRVKYSKPSDVSFDDLYSKLARLFKINDPFKLYYLDGDEDEITITDDGDIQEAIDYHNGSVEARQVTVRLMLKRVKSPSPPATVKHAPPTPPSNPNTAATSHTVTQGSSQNVPTENAAPHNKTEVVHYNVICDACTNTIKGIR